MESDEDDFFNPNMASSNLKNLFDNLDQSPDDYNSQLIFVPPKQPKPNTKSIQTQLTAKEKIEPKPFKKKVIIVPPKIEIEEKEEAKLERVKIYEVVEQETRIVYITTGDLVYHEVFEGSCWNPKPSPKVGLVIYDGRERKIEVYESRTAVRFTFVIDKETTFTGVNSTLTYSIRSKSQAMQIHFQTKSTYLDVGLVFLRLKISVRETAYNIEFFPHISEDWAEAKDFFNNLVICSKPLSSYCEQDILNAFETLGVKEEINHKEIKSQIKNEKRDNQTEHSDILLKLDKLSKEVTDSFAEILSALKQNEQIHTIEKSIESTLTQSMKNGDKLEEISNNLVKPKVPEQDNKCEENNNEIKKAYVKKLENIMKTCETQFAIFRKDVKASMDQLNENLQVTLQNHGCDLSEPLQEAIGDDIKICTYEILGKSKEWAKIVLKNDPQEFLT